MSTNNRKKVKISFAGGLDIWWSGYPVNKIYELLGAEAEYFELEIDNERADFVFVNENIQSLYSLFLEYRKVPVRIFWSLEAITPDFNLYDYAIGFDQIYFSDRYVQIHPLIFFSQYLKYGNLEKSISLNFIDTKKRFCDYIYSNERAHPSRDIFFDILNKFHFISSAGKCRNNVGNEILRVDYTDDWRQKKIHYQSSSFFSIAFENAWHPGYTTEKIITPMIACSVPIYWGNKDIYRYFNSKSFVNVHSFSSLENAALKVCNIYKDKNEYLNILSSPWMTDNQVDLYNSMRLKVSSFISLIFSSKNYEARRRPEGTWHCKYEDDILSYLKSIYSKKSTSFVKRIFTDLKFIKKINT